MISKRRDILKALAVACCAAVLPSSICLPAHGETQVQSAFSPDPRALELVLQTISGAKQSVEMSAYVYTSAPITKALIASRKRGALVRVVVDGRGNNSRKARAALNALALAGVQVRLNSQYAIHHDKFIIADRKTVQTGSFNYTQAAAEKNSENVVVVKGDPKLAKEFYGHWLERFNEAKPYTADLSGKFAE